MLTGVRISVSECSGVTNTMDADSVLIRFCQEATTVSQAGKVFPGAGTPNAALINIFNDGSTGRE